MINSIAMINYLLCLLISFSILWTSRSASLFTGNTLRAGDEALNSSSFMVSASGEFTLGFNSGYLTVRSNNYTVWVANLDSPINDTSSALLTLDKNKTVLKITDTGKNLIMLYSAPSFFSTNVVATLTDSGNLVLQDVDQNVSNSPKQMRVLWQSIDEPNVALTPEMKLKNSGEIYSWQESQTGPLIGSFSLRWDSDKLQLQVWRDNANWWSSGGFSMGRFEFINIPDESKVTVMALTPVEGARDGDPSCPITTTGCRYWSIRYYHFLEDPVSSTIGFVLPRKPLQRTNSKDALHRWIGFGISVAIVLLALVLCSMCYLIRRRKLAAENQRKIQDTLNMMNSNRPTNANGLQNDGKRGHDLSVFSYASIAAATCNFSDKNKLGQGGFGPVYKGKFVTGQEIAVKRLSKRSEQGISEFKNELILIYELQHTNLVQLFGFCIHGEERMLIYEYMPNNSLDYFLFDSTRSQQLDWDRRFSIIEGIAQGLLYLHKYSRTRIIHRDLKASNVLLDERMNPKISDFGMARIFANEEEEAKTMKIVGTRGYMSPEYVMGGNFSTKSDVYSFGVLMLEILSGRKNNSFYNDDRAINLVGYAWALWSEGAGLGLMDPTIGDSCDKDQMLRCIHVGLLCVEENAADRPTMLDVISMLINESMSLPVPKKPAFCTERNVITTAVDGNRTEIVASVNGISISDFDGR
ncbi:hypothetical protein ACLB2K_023337 [Fragaria x ananassa]